MEQLSVEEELKQQSEPIYWLDIKQDQNYKTSQNANVSKFVSLIKTPLEIKKEKLNRSYTSTPTRPKIES